MVQQCAWCLRLIDNTGQHISAVPVPKMYDASHGMCRACGAGWLAAAQMSYEGSVAVAHSEMEDIISNVLKKVRSISSYISRYLCDRR